jgi:serine phosphatase RsbU (regulator of sigma subunit)/anti-sigma regulatory factor (Ser/Thr protein kinase)
MTPLELQIPADGRAPGRVRAELKRWLVARAWPEEDREDLVFAVSEAVSNAAEHAYRSNGSSAPERVVAVVVTEMIDSGGRRAKAVVDDVGVWRSATSGQEFRGRGLRMIGALMEACDVNSRPAGTRVTMISRPVREHPRPAWRTSVSEQAGEPARTLAERLRWLEVVTDAELAQLTVDELLDELLDRVRELMAVDTAAVLLLDPSQQFLIATVARGIEEEVHQGVRIPLGRGFAGRIAMERRWVAIEQVDHSNVLNPILHEKGIVSLLGVPLVAAGVVLGVLHVGTLARRRFTEQDAALLQMVADRAALATHSRMSQVERAAASVMQRHLLPARLPEVTGLEFASRYVPGGGGHVGGDWYDVFTLPSGTVCLVVGDVVGHGLTAAQSMSQIRSVLRSITLHTENPAEVLTRLDEHVRHFQPGTMATVLCGLLPLGADVLRMSSAGHPPPVLATTQGAASTLPIPADLPLGVAAGHPRRHTDVPLACGSVLCLYSDGLVERRNLVIDENIEKLRETVTAQAPESVCVEVMRRLVAFATPEDDVAVLVVRRLATGPSATTPAPASARPAACRGGR